ncbi:hypothetical protein KSP40_PGU001649 [Platanthera guangdongensis]|uniref:Uncharacterized protein n=1 Tax=Platanthera guangdongensis TaxID=2320717 RepID=A0ABR2MWR3_9ASPA
MKAMIDSNAPFARKFQRDDSVLDRVDAELLFRGPGRVIPGGWCVGRMDNGSDPCLVVGDGSVLRPGPGAISFRSSWRGFYQRENFRPSSVSDFISLKLQLIPEGLIIGK